MQKKTITRQDLKDILRLDKKKLEEYLNARLSEEAVFKREEIEENLARLEEEREGLSLEIEGIRDLLALNVIDIIIEEGDRENKKRA